MRPPSLVLSGLLVERGRSRFRGVCGSGMSESRRLAEGDWAALLHASGRGWAHDAERSLPIAVFDSGVGGLTVLHELLVSLPAEDYVYLGDTGRFPYGTKTTVELRERVAAIAAFLCERGAKLLIIACNSATADGARRRRRGGGAGRRRNAVRHRPGGRDRGGDHHQRARRPARDTRRPWRPAPTTGRSRVRAEPWR